MVTKSALDHEVDYLYSDFARDLEPPLLSA